MTERDRLIAVDLGGARMRAACVDETGECAEVLRRSTGRLRPGREIVEDLFQLIMRCRGEAGPGRLCVGVPTVLDEAGGLTECDNLPTLTGFRLAEYLGDRCEAPVCLFNDAQCLAAGEWWRGAAQGAGIVCGVTLGTDIGLGLMFDGRLYRGGHGAAGGIWQSCWEDGTVEDRISGQALAAEYRRRSGQERDGPELAALARAGDVAALESFHQFGLDLGRVTAFIVNLLDPEFVVYGGAIAESFEFFRHPLRAVVAASTGPRVRTQLVTSRLGEKAALLGAAKLCWDAC